MGTPSLQGASPLATALFSRLESSLHRLCFRLASAIHYSRANLSLCVGEFLAHLCRQGSSALNQVFGELAEVLRGLPSVYLSGQPSLYFPPPDSSM